MVKPATVRVVLSLALSNKWHIRQLDVNNAFLNGFLEEEVYMQQPEGFAAADTSLVCRLHKALYGLKQAPRAWFACLAHTLFKLGFNSSKCDPSLFVQISGTHCIYVLVYVDDIIITGSNSSSLQQLITLLDSEFSLKDLGPLHYFLGIEVTKLSDGSLHLSQQKYIHDLLTRSKMNNAKGIATPMVSNLKLSKSATPSFSDPQLYRSIVGALQYATVTRPEISFSVNKCCQFMQNPAEEHWKAVKRVLRYLAGTVSHGIVLSPSSHLPLRGFCDADWGADPDDRRSTSGSCIFLGPNLISWWSKKQVLVARSSTEAEYRSLADTVAEILWLQSLLKELNVVVPKPTVYCDNLSTVMLAHNPVLHTRTKHMELNLFFVREKVLGQQLQVVHIPSEDQPADILTKALSSSKFIHFRKKLQIIPLSQGLNAPVIAVAEKSWPVLPTPEGSSFSGHVRATEPAVQAGNLLRVS